MYRSKSEARGTIQHGSWRNCSREMECLQFFLLKLSGPNPKYGDTMIYMYMCIIYIYRERERHGVCFYKSYMYHTCLSNLLSRWCRWALDGVRFSPEWSLTEHQAVAVHRRQSLPDLGEARHFPGNGLEGLGDVWRCFLWVVSVVASGIVDSEIPKKPPGMYKT